MTRPQVLGAALAVSVVAVCLTGPLDAKGPVPPEAQPEVREQIERLRGTNPGERAEACRRLGQMGKEAVPAIPFLAALLGDTTHYREWIDPQGPYVDHHVGQLAADALAQMGGVACGPLLRALHGGDADARFHAVGALWKMRDPPIEALFVALKEGTADVRASAALALAEICREGRQPIPVRRLVAGMDDGHPPVRLNLVRAIARVPARGRVGPLVAALQDPDARVRQAAVTGLAPVRSDARALEALLAASQDKDHEVRLTVIAALGGEVDDRAVDLLLAALKVEQPDIRQAAARSLGATRAARAVAPLMETLKDPDAGVRETAARALAETAGSAAVPALVETLKDPSAQVRRSAASALADLGDPAATEPLIAALRDESTHVRWMAARGLARFGDSRALEPLMATLKDDYWATREAAAEALARLADPRSVPTLIEALKPDYHVPGTRPIESDEPARRMKDRVAAALVKIGKPAIDPLIVLLEQTAPEDRRWPGGAHYAAEALKKITGQDFGFDAAKWRAWRGEHPRAPGAAG